MTTPDPHSNTSSSGRRWLGRLAFVLLAGATGAATAVGMGHAGGFAAMHRGAAGAHGLATPEARAAHIDEVIARVYAQTAATAGQRRQLEPILRRAADRLITLHLSMRASHVVAHELLSSEHVDRDALEALRQEHMALADQASREIVKLAADASDVLTPAQRGRLMEHVARLHGGLGG